MSSSGPLKTSSIAVKATESCPVVFDHKRLNSSQNRPVQQLESTKGCHVEGNFNRADIYFDQFETLHKKKLKKATAAGEGKGGGDKGKKSGKGTVGREGTVASSVEFEAVGSSNENDKKKEKNKKRMRQQF